MSLHDLAQNVPDNCAYCRDPFDPPGTCIAWRASAVPQEWIGHVELFGMLKERTHYLCSSCDKAMDVLLQAIREIQQQS